MNTAPKKHSGIVIAALTILIFTAPGTAKANKAKGKRLSPDLLAFVPQKTDVIVCLDTEWLTDLLSTNPRHPAVKDAKNILKNMWKQLPFPVLATDDILSLCAIRARGINEQFLILELSKGPKWLRKPSKTHRLITHGGRHILLYSKKEGLAAKMSRRAGKPTDPNAFEALLRPHIHKIERQVFWHLGLMDKDRRERFHRASSLPGKQPGPAIAEIQNVEIEAQAVGIDVMSIDFHFHYNGSATAHEDALLMSLPVKASQKSSVVSENIITIHVRGVSFEQFRVILSRF